MEWEYKNITNMTREEHNDFARNPHGWMQKQIKEALLHDSIVFKCYKTFVSLHNIEDPFKDTRFLTLLAYQALLSNSVNFNQLIEAVNRNPNPPQLLIPKGSILLSDN